MRERREKGKEAIAIRAIATESKHRETQEYVEIDE